MVDKHIYRKNSYYWKTVAKALAAVEKYVAKALKLLAEYWRNPVSEQVKLQKFNISTFESKTNRLVFSALLSSIAAIMQSAGALGGPGLIVSAFVTLPVAIAAILYVPTGVTAYITTLCLLFLIQPSEIAVFPFTTGLLGLGIGLSFRSFKTRIAVTAFGALSLTIGITFLLYILNFPVLGPIVTNNFHILPLITIYCFSFLYSWAFVEASMASLKYLSKALYKMNS